MEVVPSVSEFFQWPKFTHTNQHFMVDVTSKGCVTLCVALPFTLKSILMQNKNYGYSNISPCKNIIFKKSSKRNQNPEIKKL